jgi:hypothetical protein
MVAVSVWISAIGGQGEGDTVGRLLLEEPDQKAGEGVLHTHGVVDRLGVAVGHDERFLAEQPQVP